MIWSPYLSGSKKGEENREEMGECYLQVTHPTLRAWLGGVGARALKSKSMESQIFLSQVTLGKRLRLPDLWKGIHTTTCQAVGCIQCIRGQAVGFQWISKNPILFSYHNSTWLKSYACIMWVKCRDSQVRRKRLNPNSTTSWLGAFGKMTEASAATCERAGWEPQLPCFLGRQQCLWPVWKFLQVSVVVLMTGFYWMVWDAMFSRQARPAIVSGLSDYTTSQCPLDICVGENPRAKIYAWTPNAFCSLSMETGYFSNVISVQIKMGLYFVLFLELD